MPNTEASAQIAHVILEYAASHISKPGDSFDWVIARIKLKIPRRDFDRAMYRLVQRGSLAVSDSSRHARVTLLGFDELLS